MYAHVTGGLTLPRLKEICAASGLLSPGRARALLLYLRYLGYVVSAGRDGNKLARYAPTEDFLRAWRRHFRAALDAVSLIEPAVDLILQKLEETATLEALARHQGEEFLAATRTSPAINTPYFRIFLNRYAGTQITMVFGAAGAGPFPTHEPIAFSAAAIAKRFRVSRIHIKRMMDQAEREGFVSRKGDGEIVLEESLRTAIRESYAMQLTRLLSQSARALSESTVRAQPEAA
jgi:DNA-binding IclR family transcriptional regulator